MTEDVEEERQVDKTQKPEWLALRAGWCIDLIEKGEGERAFGYLFRMSAYDKEAGGALMREILVRRGVDPETSDDNETIDNETVKGTNNE